MSIHCRIRQRKKNKFFEFHGINEELIEVGVFLVDIKFSKLGIKIMTTFQNKHID